MQCLGDTPWISRATAMWPDSPYVARDDGNVNTGDIFPIARGAVGLELPRSLLLVADEVIE